jgi:anti-anti-sigma factor
VVVGVGNTQTGKLLFGRDERGIFLTAQGSIRAPLCYPLRESLLPQIEELAGGQSVFVDLSECVYMDSTCIGILVAMDKKVRKASGGRLHVLNPSAASRASLEDIGLGGYFTLGEEKVAPPTVMTEVAEPGDRPTAQFVLDAHEALIETSAEAKKRFSALKDILQRALKSEKPPRDTP